MDYEAAGLLDGLEGEDRQTRRRLLDELAQLGFDLDELKAAAAEERLALLPVTHMLGGRYSAEEVQERTGVSAKLLLRIRRLSGLPEVAPGARVFGDDDIELANSTKLFLDAGFPEQAIVEITRVLGEGLGRAAATVTAGFAEAFLRPGDNELEVAHRFVTLTERLMPAMEPVLVAGFKAHLRESVRRGMLRRGELEAGQLAGAANVAVGFVDMVGFTRLGGEVEVQELGTVAGSLASLAAEVTVEPVRLVKTIGDAAMYVSEEPGALVAVTLSLLEAIEEAELPTVRAGIAWGPALLRAGDYFGHAVNVASRVTGVARPGSVLCTQEVHDAAPEDFSWSFAGRHRLKGVSPPPPLYRARRRSDPEAKPPPEGRSRRRGSS